MSPCCAWMGTWAGASFTLVWAASGVGNGTPGGAGLTVSPAWVMLSLSPSASLSCFFSLPPSGPRTRFCRRGPSAYIPAPFLPVALELWLQVSITPPIPTPAHPLLGKQLPLFLLLEDGNWKHYEKPKFLATCGWRGPSVLLSPGPSRSVSPLAPASWPPPPSAGLPLASGQDPQAPCYRNHTAGCAAIKQERPRPLCCASWGHGDSRVSVLSLLRFEF